MKRIRTLLFSSFVLAGLSATASLSVQIVQQQRPICTYSNGSLKAQPSGGQAVPIVHTGSTLRLDVQALAPGVYLLRMENSIARFVKN